MQEPHLRANTPDYERLEKRDRRGIVHNKFSKFYGRTCVALVAAGLVGSVYYLSSWQSRVQETSLHGRLNTSSCFDASQFTNKTGMRAPNEGDLYCIYPDQNIPGQMAGLVATGIVGLIEQAGTMVFHGAKSALACISSGLSWRQYYDQSVCVRMDSGTCESLGGHASSGSSVCIPAINLEEFASAHCTRDLVNLCEWRSQEAVRE